MAAKDLIRPAVTTDLPRLEAMGEKFFAASGLDRWFTFKPGCFSKFCAYVIPSEESVLWVGDGQNGAVAMAGAMSYPCVMFNDEHVTCQEFCWWVEPDFRGEQLGKALREGLEDFAHSKGCLTMEMGALEMLRPDVLFRLYESLGYGPKERIFCKRLT